MDNTLDERGKALEDGYFRQHDNELIAKMRAKIAANTTTETTNHDCPKCDGKLQTSSFESISIDVCDKCGGAWLDAGELQQIAHPDKKGWFSRLAG